MLAEIFSSNIRKLLSQNGWSYARLAELTEGKLSKAYVSAFRYGNKINPSLEVVEIIADVFKVPPQQLLDPHTEYNRAVEAPKGYMYKEYLVNDTQDYTISKWEKINRDIIRDKEKQAYDRLQKLKN